MSRDITVGWAVLSNLWGKGFATEMASACVDIAFRAVRLESVVAFAVPDNTASIRVMEKTGFVYEKDVDWDGRRHVVYRLTRPAV